MSIGLDVARGVAMQLLADRIRHQDEKMKDANKMRPAIPQNVTPTFDRGAGESDFQAQRAGERMEVAPTEPPAEPMPMIYDDLMGLSLQGSGKFTKGELRQGYRRLGKG